MARIVSSKKPADGVGYQYNIEGMGSIVAIVTSHGPGIGAQGEVESLLLASSLLEGVAAQVVDGQVTSDVDYQRGFKAGYDRASAEVRNCLVECDSELSAQGHGRPPSSRDELLRLSGICRDLTKPKMSEYHQ